MRLAAKKAKPAPIRLQRPDGQPKAASVSQTKKNISITSLKLAIEILQLNLSVLGLIISDIDDKNYGVKTPRHKPRRRRI